MTLQRRLSTPECTFSLAGPMVGDRQSLLKPVQHVKIRMFTTMSLSNSFQI